MKTHNFRSKNRKKSVSRNRLTAAITACLMLVLQCAVILPAVCQPVHAETAGDVLAVRVQYFGESGNKIREKTRFSKSELQAMGAETYCYSNVTSVGTVMSMKATGPQVLTILEKAGIDLGSIQNITFKTTDGYTRNFSVAKHLTSSRYYYPNLSSAYERSEDGQTLIPLPGSLDGGVMVPSILAMEFGASKTPGVYAEDLSMSTKETYRFCLGQSPLQENVTTRAGYDGGDVSSMDSAHSIYGIDVTLYGSPVSDMQLSIDSRKLKIGSKKRIAISFSGDDLFKDALAEYAGKITWTSSDPDIAEVDQNGNVTIKKQGEVTITATTESGLSRSIVLNGVGGSKTPKDDSAKPEKTKDPKAVKNPAESEKSAESAKQSADSTKKVKQQNVKEARQMVMKEVVLGDEIVPEMSQADKDRQSSMADDAQALGKTEQFSKGAAAGSAVTAAAACGAGVFGRIRKFNIDMKR